VIHVTAAVEHDLLDAGRLGAFGNQLADGLRPRKSAPVLRAERRSFSSVDAEASVWPLRVVDDLRIDVLGRAIHRQARTAVEYLLDLNGGRGRGGVRRLIVSSP
jgi:hypothetical protein